MSGTYDNYFLDTLVVICQESSIFYQEMSERINSLALSSLFREMSRSRACTKANLEVFQAELKQTNDCFDDVAGAIISAYHNLKQSLADDGDLKFMERLEEAETQVLETFRTGIQQVSNPVLAEKLAIHIATMQLNYDRLKTMKFDLERHPT